MSDINWLFTAPYCKERVASVKAQLAGEKEGYKIKRSPAGDKPGPPRQPKGEIKAKREALKAKLKQIEASIQENPTDAQLYVERGNTMGKLIEVSGPAGWVKYGSEMAEAFEKAIQLKPENVGGHLGRGMIRFFTPEVFGGDLEGAISDFEFVLSKEPSNIEANF